MNQRFLTFQFNHSSQLCLKNSRFFFLCADCPADTSADAFATVRFVSVSGHCFAYATALGIRDSGSATGGFRPPIWTVVADSVGR